jgi:glycosyltransferase involved in cell wall biosynthesis
MSFQATIKKIPVIGHDSVQFITNQHQSPNRVDELPQHSSLRGLGAPAVARIIWDRIVRRRQVFVAFSDIPRKLNFVQRLALSMADGVLAATDMIAPLSELGIDADRIIVSDKAFDISKFAACALTRRASVAHRMIYAGDFSPESGVVDFLSCVMTWAETNPTFSTEVVWLGRGDLQGILLAQLLPSNLSQSFADPTNSDEMVEYFATAGLLIEPALVDGRSAVLPEALMSGLPVLGSVRSSHVRSFVIPGSTGWLFDPFDPETVFAALDSAFSTTPVELDALRSKSRSLITGLQSETTGEGNNLPRRKSFSYFMPQDPVLRAT